MLSLFFLAFFDYWAGISSGHYSNITWDSAECRVRLTNLNHGRTDTKANLLKRLPVAADDINTTLK